MPEQKLISRRRIMKLGLGATYLSRLGTMSAYAQATSSYKALVCIYMGGGCDGNNLLVPLDSARYAKYQSLRGNVALAANALLPVTASNGEAYGLHPNLAGLAPFFSQNQLAWVANVGNLIGPITKTDLKNGSPFVPGYLYSHSDQTSQWQKLLANPNSSPAGWSGRVADKIQNMNYPSTFPTAVSMTSVPSQLMGAQSKPIGITPNKALALSSASNPVVETAMQEMFGFDSGATLVQAARSFHKDGVDTGKLISSALLAVTPIATAFPNTDLGRQLKQVAQLIQIRQQLGMQRQIFYCSFGSFDHHTNLLTSQVDKLTQLNDAIVAFYNALGELNMRSNVTTFTESEFGRTLNPNGDNGADHGWGNNHFILGGALKKGDVYGKYPELALGGPDDSSSRGTWIPTTSVDQYAATLSAWFGVSLADLLSVFPNLNNFATKNLGFLNA